MSNYTTKTDLENAAGIDTSNSALKSNLASLKAEVDKINVDKLNTAPVDLSKVSNVVNNDVVKKTAYDKLFAKKNNIDTSELVLKTKHDTDKSELEKKILDTSGLDKKLDYNAKITEIESEIPSISGLATSSGLTAVENNSSLVKNNNNNKKKKKKKRKKKQIITQKLVKLKRKFPIITATNKLLLQNLISLRKKFLMKD